MQIHKIEICMKDPLEYKQTCKDNTIPAFWLVICLLYTSDAADE